MEGRSEGGGEGVRGGGAAREGGRGVQKASATTAKDYGQQSTE